MTSGSSGFMMNAVPGLQLNNCKRYWNIQKKLARCLIAFCSVDEACAAFLFAKTQEGPPTH